MFINTKMRQNPNRLLSVIIPAHNEEKTIIKTVDSLLIQKYYPLEIIVVDDGSTDNTSVKLIDRYRFKQAIFCRNNDFVEIKNILRIWQVRCNGVGLYLIEKENGGKGDALNIGLRFSHGEYFVLGEKLGKFGYSVKKEK